MKKIKSLKEWARTKRIPPYKLAKMAGVGQGTIYRLFNGEKRKYQYETLAKISRTTGIEIADLLKARQKNGL